jgi:heme-degrading monooxygenase HmoA
MINIMAKVAFEELPRFVEVFSTRGAEMRRMYGSISSQVFTPEADSKSAVILFEWESRAAFAGFLGDPAVRETLKSGGTIGAPEFTFLEKVGEYQD